MKTDVLVIGSGIAGLYFSLKCAGFARVVLATKDSLQDSNTSKAQGGIAAALDMADSLQAHFDDTITVGDGLCNPIAVNCMVSDAPSCIYELQQMGVPFNCNETGKFLLALEGGHSAARVAHVNDQTGAGIINTLIALVKAHSNITVLEDYFAIDIITHNHTCCGAWFIDEKKQEMHAVQSQVTFLATGGAGSVYKQNTNPAGATGDGFAMAWRAGALMQNMEFVQFHPTMLYTGTGENFLISEAVRGFGAQLVNTAGKPFMQHYHPMGSLAPRDVVTRAITEQMQKDNSPCVYLDTPKLNIEKFKHRFPAIYTRCHQLGIDISKQRIPVIPAAHYMCGGVVTDLHGKTNITGLYACGETACTGVHGANRLASNSLLEGLVFAREAAKVVKDNFKNLPLTAETVSHCNRTVNTSKIPVLKEIREQLGNLMWEKAGIIRNAVLLKAALEQLNHWEVEIVRIGMMQGINRELMETLNLMQTSRLIAVASLKREESRGVHYRSDFPEHSAGFEHSTKQKKPVLF